MATEKRYAKYLRYSRVHGDREPDSIKNQELIIDNFIEKQRKETGANWIPHDVYIDIDCTGANFMRPEFLRMKEDIEAGKINVVISKDSSRFGRNVATEVYFSEIFPKYGTIFIGVIDNTDTSNDSQVLERQIRGMMNENYSRDISNKVRSAMYAMMAEGKFLGSSAPYGFLRHPDDKHKLIVDEDVRPVIHRIAKLYLEGYGLRAVSNILNDEENGPLPPALYKEQKGINYHNKNANRGLWSVSTVRRILTDDTYNGVLVQHKAANVNFKIRNKKKVAENNWIRVEGAIDKILDDDTWALIQKRIKMRSKVVGGRRADSLLPQNLYSGVIFCADCGSLMNYRSDLDIYACGMYNKYGKKYCDSHRIKTKEISDVVLRQIEVINKLSIEVRQLYNEIRKKIREKESTNVVQIKIKQGQKRLGIIENALKILREERAGGIIGEDEYRKNREEYVREMKDIQVELGKLNNKIVDSKMIFQSWEDKMEDIDKTYEKYFTITALDRELVIRLVDRIVVGKDRNVSEITFKGTSPFELAKELKQEIDAIATG